MQRLTLPALATAGTLLVGIGLILLSPGGIRSGPGSPGGAAAGSGRPAPDFPSADPNFWINSAPLTMAGLRGHVVLLDVWTFG